MLSQSNIFNIPANYHFFESLFFWLEENFSEKLPQVKIFLPNRRSCREFSELFLSKKTATFLPKIKAISDISFEDFFDFLPNAEARQVIDEILEIKPLSGIDHLIFLSKEIQKLAIFGNNLEFGQAFKIALNLQNLFEDIEREEIDLSKLDEIDDSDMSKHRQLTLDFLKNFHVKIKNSLLKQNIFLSTSSQNFIIQRFSYLLENFGSKNPIILAGSSGSIASGRRLIKAVAKENHVVLYGATADDFEAENHPQFFLNSLANFLEIDKNLTEKIAPKNFALSDKNRQNFLSLLMLPNEKVFLWQEVAEHLDVNKIAQDLENNFQLIEAKNEIEEAKIIALILREAFENKKTSALISNNNRLSDLVGLELERFELPFNDVRNLSIFNSKLVNFLLSILELIESDFNSHNLLAVLKNPLCCYSQDQKLLAEFEIKILRQDRRSFDLAGINERLKIVNQKDLSDFFSQFCTDILINKTLPNLASQTISLIKTVENLSQKTWQKLLENEPAQIEIFEFFEKIKLQSDIELNVKNITSTFKTLLAQISYFKKSDAKAPIQILSTIEARLLNHDLVVIGSLNEGDFPQIEDENWLGKKIKKDLGINRTLKKVGQNAFDFCNYLSNKSVVLSRCKSNNSATLIESPFLLKFKTLVKKIGANLNQGEKYFLLLKEMSSLETLTIQAPNPKPPLKFRPQKISITEISKLISNPYDIYAKKILQLKELEKIDFEPSYAEFGSFIHKALEEFIKNSHEEDFLQKSEEIFEKYFLSSEAKLVWWPKFKNIFSDFIQENAQFLSSKNYLEIPVKLSLEGLLISGKIDRVIIDEEGLVEIFDYKTGQVPSKKDVELGINPQLTISALMLLEGMIEAEIENISSEKITTLGYWKLSASSASEIKKICDKNEEVQILVAAAKSGLTKLFQYFADEKNGYIATKNNERSEYKNLARISK